MFAPVTEPDRRHEALALAGGQWRGRVVVVSPHLDDAVLSLGASIRAAVRAGVAVDVLTVLSGDPEATGASDASNAKAGFATAGEAAKARRREDARACRLVGARPVWLPFSDDHNESPPDEAAVTEDLRTRLTGYDAVLLPGHPLGHPDHRLVSRLALEALEPGRTVGFYVEQPYASWRALSRNTRDLLGAPALTAAELGVQVSGTPSWHRMRCRPSDWARKQAACGAYVSQMAVLRRAPRIRVFAYELLHRGEAVLWCTLR